MLVVSYTLLVGGSGVGGTYRCSGATGGAITSGFIGSGIGYQVGDILTILGGNNDATITLTAVKTVQFRMVPWEQDITLVAYSDLTYTNLQSSFAAMVDYDSNVGLQFQLRVSNDSNVHDLNSALIWYSIFTLVDPDFNPPIGYIDINFSGLQNNSRIAAYSGSILLDSDISSTISTLTVPYTFDGTTATTDIKIKKYGYLDANYSQQYNKENVNTGISQTVDNGILESNESVVIDYTDLSSDGKIYDYNKYFYCTSASDLRPSPCTKNGTIIDFGDYNIVIDGTAASIYSITGNTITMRCSSPINSPLVTNGTISFINGASSNTWYASSAGTSVIISAPNLINGTRYQLWNITENTEINNDVIVGTGLVYRITWSENITIRLRATYQSGLVAKNEVISTGVLTNTGLTFLDSQTDEATYNLNAIDGSTVTEFSPDYINATINITDPDGVTSVQRMHAWYHHVITSENGIRNFFKCVEANDVANYQINSDILNLKLFNVNTAPVVVVGGYLYRLDGETVIASTSNSIQMDPAKAYVSKGVTLSEIENSSVLAKEATVASRLSSSQYTAPDNAKIDAIKTKIDTLNNTDLSGVVTLAQIENSGVLAKEATVQNIQSGVVGISGLVA